MNDRINEFMRQAYRIALKESKNKAGEHYCNEGSDYFQALEKEIFAELIVRECILQCEKRDPRPDKYSDMEEFAESRKVRECVSSIKEHFGVK